MTFAVMLLKDDQAKVIGTLWAKDEANARATVLMLSPRANGELVRVCRAEDREIPLRLWNTQAMRFD